VMFQVEFFWVVMPYSVVVGINSISNKEELPQSGRKLLLYLFIKSVIKLTVVIIQGYHCYQLHKKNYIIFLSQC
jgi:Na+/H+-dicarboxylate symporter